jgi:hypothetical protein
LVAKVEISSITDTGDGEADLAVNGEKRDVDEERLGLGG